MNSPHAPNGAIIVANQAIDDLSTAKRYSCLRAAVLNHDDNVTRICLSLKEFGIRGWSNYLADHFPTMIDVPASSIRHIGQHKQSRRRS